MIWRVTLFMRVSMTQMPPPRPQGTHAWRPSGLMASACGCKAGCTLTVATAHRAAQRDLVDEATQGDPAAAAADLHRQGPAPVHERIDIAGLPAATAQECGCVRDAAHAHVQRLRDELHAARRQAADRDRVGD